MGLLTLTQIPCHHVLANEISLNLKYRIGLKQFFNINLGIGIKKKLLFLFVFLTYLPVFLLKFRSGELVGCGIKFHIQRVPTRHTFDGPHYPKNKKYLKNVMITYQILQPTSSLDRNLSKTIERYVENTNKKVVLSFIPPKLINIILLF